MGSTPIKSSARWNSKVGGQNYAGTSPAEMARRNAAYALSSVEGQGLDARVKGVMAPYGVNNIGMWLAAAREFNKIIKGSSGPTLIAKLTAAAGKYASGFGLDYDTLLAMVLGVFGITLANPRVTYPNGGETLTVGTPANITWTGFDGAPSVDIDISRDNGGTWASVQAAAPNTGTFNWTPTAPPSALCLIRVTSTVNPLHTDTSDAVFTINAPPPPPSTPSNPSPVDGASDVPIETDLDWADSSNTTSYTVYFGTTFNPPWVGTTVLSEWALGTLNASTVYYWKIVANGPGGSTAGPTWAFLTEA